jgi:succinoglycan biosynthesis transport protein ExoP
MSDMTETTGPAPGSRFTWSGLARRLPIVALLLVVGTGLGFLGARQQPATYTATATVLVEPADGNPYAPGTRGQNLANLGTEAQLVSSDAVAQIAKTTLRSNASVAALVEQLTVSTPPNSQVLEVSYADITPVAARNGANAFANAYLVARERRAAQSVQVQINNLTKARAANQSALTRNVTALAKTQAGTPARVLAEQRVTTATQEATKLESQLSDLRLYQGDPGQVLSPATVPTGAAGLPNWILPAAGAALGLLLGLVFAIWRSLNDRALRTVDDVKALGYPVLSTVTTTAGVKPEALLVDAAAELPEGARLLRSVLGVSSPDGGAVLLVQAGSVESHTSTPLVLAAALARADQAVTLVDTDGELTQAARLTEVDGVAEVLNDLAEPAGVAKEYQPNLRFVPVGAGHSGSVDKLASPQMRVFLDELIADSRWLLVAGPIASAPETLTLADLCTDVVILVSLRQTTSADLQHAADAVTRGGAKLVGVVVDTPRRRRNKARTEETAAVAVVAAPVIEVVDEPQEDGAELTEQEVPAHEVTTNGVQVNGAAVNGVVAYAHPSHELPGYEWPGHELPAPELADQAVADRDVVALGADETEEIPVVRAEDNDERVAPPWFPEDDSEDDSESGDETDYASLRRLM